jgi:hypothetical protein
MENFFLLTCFFFSTRFVPPETKHVIASKAATTRNHSKNQEYMKKQQDCTRY